MKAPLQLDRYFFTKLQIEANAAYIQSAAGESPGTENNQDIKLRLDLGLGEHKEDPTKFQVVVGIDELRSEKGELPYRIALEVIGQFSVDKNFKPENLRKLVQVNGASMLYSAARELVLTVTGRGPWPAYQLPAISLYDAVDKAESEGLSKQES
jgi:preprotein translocase subunit SecB